jgi:membrane-associated phospholipid phosphatase
MPTPHANTKLPLVTGLCALIGLGIVAALVLTHASAGFDRSVHEWTVSHRRLAGHALFLAISTVGGIWSMRALAVVACAALWYRRRPRAATSLATALIAGTLLFEAVKRLVERPRPPFGYSRDPTFAFPSGHATVSAAVVCSLAYILWRERVITRSVALSAAIAAPLLVGISRIYLDMHWTTDVLGGWCAGIVVASGAGLIYELISIPQNYS